jgi:hypothetical protein
MELARPALIAYSFAPIEPPRDGVEPVQEHLRRLWRAWSELGATEPLAHAPVGVEIPDWPDCAPDNKTRVLAAKQQLGEGEVRQAFLLAQHDVVVQVGCLAPNRAADSSDTWQALYNEWHARAGGDARPAAALGEAVLLIGALPADGLDLNARERAVWAALNPHSSAAGRGGRFRMATGVALWEAERSSGRRLFAALAPIERESELESWVWAKPEDGYPELAPFGRYLLHAAKLRYQLEVYLRDAPAIRRAREGTDRAIAGAAESRHVQRPVERVDALVAAQQG